MGSFSSSTTTDSRSTGTNTQTEAPNVTAFRNSLYPQIQNLLTSAQAPVYGQAQQAQMQNAVNQSTQSGINQLTSNLAARTGSVNSGAYAAGLQGLLGQRSSTMSNYAMQVPMLNQQARMQNTLAGLGLANIMAGPALRGSLTSGTQNSTTTSNPSIMSDIGSVAGMAGAAFGLPGVGSLFGGGSPMSGLGGQMYGNNMMGNISSQMGGGGWGLGNMSDIIGGY